MVRLVRLMVYRNGVTDVIDCAYSEVKKRGLDLSQEEVDLDPLRSSVMAAYSDIISTLGGATSNSYVSGTDADQFAALQSRKLPGWPRLKANGRSRFCKPPNG